MMKYSGISTLPHHIKKKEIEGHEDADHAGRQDEQQGCRSRVSRLLM